MGHSVNYFICGNSELKKSLKRYLATAYDPEESSSYHGNMTIHKDVIAKDYDDAMAKIEHFDVGWYSDHAVRYKDGRKYMWLVKYEYHC